MKYKKSGLPNSMNKLKMPTTGLYAPYATVTDMLQGSLKFQDEDSERAESFAKRASDPMITPAPDLSRRKSYIARRREQDLQPRYLRIRPDGSGDLDGDDDHPGTVLGPDGLTFVSPSIYVVYQTIRGYDKCAQLGPQHTNIAFAFKPGELSSIDDFSGKTLPYDFGDLPCPPKAWQTVDWRDRKDLHGQYVPYEQKVLNYRPRVVGPESSIAALDPEWKNCRIGDIDNGYDPPRALARVGAAPTTSQDIGAIFAPSPKQQQHDMVAPEKPPSVTPAAKGKDPVAQGKAQAPPAGNAVPQPAATAASDCTGADQVGCGPKDKTPVIKMPEVGVSNAKGGGQAGNNQVDKDPQAQNEPTKVQQTQKIAAEAGPKDPVPRPAPDPTKSVLVAGGLTLTPEAKPAPASKPEAGGHDLSQSPDINHGENSVVAQDQQDTSSGAQSQPPAPAAGPMKQQGSGQENGSGNEDKQPAAQGGAEGPAQVGPGNSQPDPAVNKAQDSKPVGTAPDSTKQQGSGQKDESGQGLAQPPALGGDQNPGQAPSVNTEPDSKDEQVQDVHGEPSNSRPEDQPPSESKSEPGQAPQPGKSFDVDGLTFKPAGADKKPSQQAPQSPAKATDDGPPGQAGGSGVLPLSGGTKQDSQPPSDANDQGPQDQSGSKEPAGQSDNTGRPDQLQSGSNQPSDGNGPPANQQIGGTGAQMITKPGDNQSQDNPDVGGNGVPKDTGTDVNGSSSGADGPQSPGSPNVDVPSASPQDSSSDSLMPGSASSAGLSDVVDAGGSAPSALEVAGQQVQAGGPVITVSGTPISLGSSALVVGTKTVPLPTPSAQTPKPTHASVFSIQGTGVTVGQPPVTIAGSTVSLATDSIVINDKAILIPTSSVLKADHHEFKPIGSTAVSIEGQTVSLSGPAYTASDGKRISLGSSGLEIGSSTYQYANFVPVTAQDGNSNLGMEPTAALGRYNTSQTYGAANATVSNAVISTPTTIETTPDGLVATPNTNGPLSSSPVSQNRAPIPMKALAGLTWMMLGLTSILII